MTTIARHPHRRATAVARTDPSTALGRAPTTDPGEAGTLPPMDLQCTTSRVGDAVVLALGGYADLSTAPRLQSQLQLAVGEHRGERVVVDIDGLVALDDVALGLLLGAAARAREDGGELVLVGTNARIRQRLAATRVDRVVTVLGSIAES